MAVNGVENFWPVTVYVNLTCLTIASVLTSKKKKKQDYLLSV